MATNKCSEVFLVLAFYHFKHMLTVLWLKKNYVFIVFYKNLCRQPKRGRVLDYKGQIEVFILMCII